MRETEGFSQHAAKPVESQISRQSFLLSSWPMSMRTRRTDDVVSAAEPLIGYSTVKNCDSWPPSSVIDGTTSPSMMSMAFEVCVVTIRQTRLKNWIG